MSLGFFGSQIAKWLAVQPTDEASVYKTVFAEHHLGNTFIRSLHGGVTGSMIELCAEAGTHEHLENEADVYVVSSSIDYLRVTKDQDLFARVRLQRMSRRLSVMDVYCWQDNEDTIVARGIVTLKIDSRS